MKGEYICGACGWRVTADHQGETLMADHRRTEHGDCVFDRDGFCVRWSHPHWGKRPGGEDLESQIVEALRPTHTRQHAENAAASVMAVLRERRMVK